MANEKVTWIDPASTSYVFDGSSNYTALWGRQGFFAPPTSVIEMEVPLQPGARLRFVKTLSRPLKVPLLIACSSESVLATTRRTLRFALNPNRGTGTLRVNAADGSQRDMSAYCDAGFEGDETDVNRGPGWAIVPLSFRALDPYWYDSAFTTVTNTTFGTPFNVVNNGDVQTWPIFTITGPGVNPTLVNNTTGKSMVLTVTLAASQTVTIDTRPNIKTVVREDGSLHYAYLSPISSLWPLVTGTNAVLLNMTGTTGASQLQVQYKQAYEGY